MLKTTNIFNLDITPFFKNKMNTIGFQLLSNTENNTSLY